MVHGGGAALTRTLTMLGKQSEFINGLRVTDGETRDVALMVSGWLGEQRNWLPRSRASSGRRRSDCRGGDGLVFLARRRRAGRTWDLSAISAAVDTRWLEAIWSEQVEFR